MDTTNNEIIMTLLQILTMVIMGVIGFFVRGVYVKFAEMKSDIKEQFATAFKEIEKKQDIKICEVIRENVKAEQRNLKGDINGVGAKLEVHIQEKDRS